MRTRALIRALALALAAAAQLPAAASASQLIDRNAADVRLAVDGRGRALVTYTTAGAARRVLAWGAINARHPASGVPQLAFRLDYSGPTSFRGSCARYDGPALAWLVVACSAPDGSYWALQSWRRALPMYGVAPTRQQAARELRLSHWRGPLAVLRIDVESDGPFDRLVGSFSYRGRPVHGLRSTRRGSPLDGYGRNVYVDTHGSAYGGGWRRENAFLTHRPTGAFRYAFFPRAGRPSGQGTAYRATVIGPGVTPDVFWQTPTALR